MTSIKICGIRDVEIALVIGQAGADYLGLVFADSPRMATPEGALQIIEKVHQRKLHPAVVGVFANMEAEELNRVAEYCQLDYVQLSSDETWEYCRKIRKPIIKTIHIHKNKAITDILSEIETGYRLLRGKSLIYLLDTKVGDVYGGTGQTFDWQVAKEVCSRFPVIIAGGLTPENVGRLVGEVKAWGVDVSSGVESNGQNDLSKIRSFITAVRKAECNPGSPEGP